MPMSAETRQKIRRAMLEHYERRRRGEKVDPAYPDSLRGYGYDVMLRDLFQCQYCGYDGRDFKNWLQLSIDHVRPTHQDGVNLDSNRKTVCHACNSITSRMKFSQSETTDEIIVKKKRRVAERLSEYRKFWEERVAVTKK